jgi:hypothetical protein
MKGTATSEMAKTFKEFKHDGGMTAFYGIRELSDTIDQVNKDLGEDLSGTKTRVKGALKGVGDYVSNWNLVIENGTRLAVYKALTDRFIGNSKDPDYIKRARERAAYISKNATVNFNMGGEQKALINAFYLFYNASLQGTFAMLNPMSRSKKVRRAWGAVLLAGIMQDVIMSMISPEDDDGENQYDKIPNHILEHNIVFMDPFGISERGYAKLPMPYGMNAIFNAGRTVSRAMRGGYSFGEAANSMFGTMLDTMNPLGGTYHWLNAVAPTVLDPFIDVYRNTGFDEKPIAQAESPFGVDKVASQRYWNNTNPVYTTISNWLHELTGGEGSYIPGMVEFSPNHIDYWTNYILGGAGSFVARTAHTGIDLWKATQVDLEEFDVNNAPFVRRVVGNVTTRNDMEEYVNNRDRYATVLKAVKDARESGNPQYVKSLMDEYKKDIPVANQMKNLEAQRKKLNDRLKSLEKSTVPEAQKKEMEKRIRDQINELIGRANSLVNKAA